MRARRGSFSRWLPGWNKRYTRARPAPGRVRFGDLRRIAPISREYGFDRGLPIDRYYIDRFLALHAAKIHGDVLEVGDDSYTRRFGKERVTHRDVLHVSDGNPKATIVGDLTSASHIPSDNFDCIVLTQTLHLIYDVRAALRTLYRILKPYGVLLATFPGVSQMVHDRWRECWCWSFTQVSTRRLFEEIFPGTNLTIEVAGNVLVATAFLQGLAAEELLPEELNHLDPDYEFLIMVTAAKPAAQA